MRAMKVTLTKIAGRLALTSTVSLVALLSFAAFHVGIAHAEDVPSAESDTVPVVEQVQPPQSDANSAEPKSAESGDVPELPLTGPAFRLTNEADEAYGRGDYELAIAKAREAIRQRPDAARPRGVLINALEASGHTEEAQREIEALSHLGPTASTAEIGQVQNQIAHTHAEKVYRALERNDNADAIKNAREAVRLNPDESSYRLLLISVLLKESDYKDAIAAASDALENDSEDANSLVMRAYARQKLGDVADANKDLDQALEQDWLSDADQRSIRLIAIDAAIAARDFGRARKLLDGMDKNAEDVKSRWQALKSDSGRVLAMPATDCRVTPYGRVCSVTPGQPAPDAGYQAASEAYKAFAAHDYAAASAKAREASRLSPENEGYKKLLASILAAQKMAASVASGASGKAGRIPVSRPDPGYEAARKIGALVNEKREKEAKAAYNQALSSGKLNSLAPLDLAYLASRIGDKTTAYEQFGVARAQGKLHKLQLVDAAYAARRVYDNEQAIELLKQAIEEMGDTMTPQELFNLRREVATLSRTWGAYLSVSHGSTGAMPGGPISAYAVDQLGSEIYWRPPGIGYRDGAIFELFARNFITLHDQSGGVTGFPTAQPSFGARWKPFRNYNLVFEAARLFRFGKYSRNDTMLRVAYSDGEGTDLRVDVPSWWMWQGYGELGRYLETQQTFGSFDMRAGRSYRLDSISDRLVLTPFVGVAGNLDSLLENQLAAGAGPGLNLRWWFREDKYTAPMSYVDLNVQYKFRLSRDDRAEGLFANLTVAY